ncbi:unconventional myosin-VIIa [Octopus sinensis]|uniref:Unconventional myosin-VIIa n=1 Tax=Octopus sinensis TaxID=2607531 RepID=A0A6P7TKX7_9MOLL|nr:unconventional myosin-VIIa [Octopus sinensis]
MWLGFLRSDDQLQEPQLLNAYGEMPVSDIVHLKYPVFAENVISCLDMRFIRGLLETWLGPSLIIINPYSNAIKSSSEQNPDDNSSCRLLRHKVTEVLQELFQTKLPQTFILRGESGSGKSYNAKQILYSLFSQTNQGLSRSSCFTKVTAALTVLCSFTNVSTKYNSDSSRVGIFIQNYVCDYSVYKTKINCLYIDHARLTCVEEGFNNYHIFFEMLAGLTAEEKRNLYLDNYQTFKEFNYLSTSDPPADFDTLKRQFQEWKDCLITCDVSFTDVTRVLSAVLLIGNITFLSTNSQQLDLKTQNELKSVATLLGISSMVLYQGLTTKTINTPEGLNLTPILTTIKIHENRDALAQALYVRTVHMIVRKANSLLRTHGAKKGRNPSNASGSCKSDDRLSAQKSFHSTTSDKSVPTETDRQIPPLLNIIDMFGFENLTDNKLEQLAINFCSELLESYHNSHAFNTSRSSSKDETRSKYPELIKDRCSDNQLVVDLISHPVNGIFKLLNESVRESRSHIGVIINRIEATHSRNSCLSINSLSSATQFTIHHYAGRVTYDASTFIARNKNTISDDVVWIFSQENCAFGFGTHLFYQEIGDASVPGPQGKLYKILPRAGIGRLSKHTNTLAEDFCLKLNEIIKKISITKPHFIYCLKSNDSSSYLTFETEVIRRQLQSLQIVTTANIIKTTPIHRIKYSLFNNLYKLLLPKISTAADQSQEELCKNILEHLKEISRNFNLETQAFDWMFRQHHLLFSEQVRQELEAYKLHILYQSAVIIQTQWRGYQCRKRWPFLFQHLQALQLRRLNSLPNEYNPVFVTSSVPKLDWNTVKQICATYGINPSVTPPVPPARHYSVAGNMKVNFPQTRIATEVFKIGKHVWLQEGDDVKVLMPSSTKDGHLTVQFQGVTQDVPHHIVQLRTMGTLL